MSRVSQIGGRYAAALFTAAERTGNLIAVERDLIRLKSMLDKNVDVLRNPSISSQNKSSTLKAFVTDAKHENLTLKFIEVLAENHRLSNFLEIIGKFVALAQSNRKEIQVKLTISKVPVSGNLLL